MTPGRYLLVRLSAIGDVVFAFEALAALRAFDPEARIDWLVEDRIRDVVAIHPSVERVLCYPRRELRRTALRPWLWLRFWRLVFGHMGELRRTKYDAVLDLHGNLKSALQVLCTRAARKIGFAAPRAKEWSWLAVKERVAVPSPRPHRSDEGLLLVSRVAGRDLARPPHPILPVDAAARARAAAWLASHNEDVVARKPRIVLAPGTSAFAAFKRWPAARFAELAERLHLAGHRVIVSTGPGEGELGLQVCERSGALWFDGAAHGLATALEVLRCADVCVAADSGPLHLAQAVGVPVVGVFGPKDPRVYGPRLQPSLVLRYPTACAPCGRRRCALPTCVQAVAVDDVYEATQRVLAARRQASAQ